MRILLTLLTVHALALCAFGQAPDDYAQDFDTFDAARWQGSRGQTLEVQREGGNAYLRPAGRSRGTVAIPCGERRDFDLRVDIRGVGGVHFREGFKLFFKGTGAIWCRRPGAMLLRWVREPRDLRQFHTMRVVAAGRILRIYVDDVLELECLDHAPKAAPIYLRGAADFDRIRVSAHVPAHEALIALPVDAGADFFEENSYERLNVQGPRVKDTALAFQTDEDIRVPVQVLNEGEESEKVSVRGALVPYGGERVAGEKQAKVKVAPGGRSVVDLDFERIKPGFYRMSLALSAGGETVRETSYPVFVGVPETPAAFERPAFPFGVTLAIITWKPIHTKTYWHAMASALRAHNVNTVVATGGCHREFPEIFQRYGIATIVRSANRVEHPSVLGLMVWAGMPMKVMRSVMAETDKPVMKPGYAERVGDGTQDDPLEIWKADKPPIRLLRIHPFRKGQEDWLSGDEEQTPLLDALRAVNSGFDSPWWALLQAADDGAQDILRDPTPAELRVETHLALAHGAKGIFFHSYQGGRRAWRGTGRDWRAMVDPVTLHPVDDKLKTVGALGALVKKHGGLLKEMTRGKHDVHSDVDAVLCVPVMCAGKPGVYVVNTDTRQAVSCRLSWGKAVQATRVRDIYADAALEPDAGSLSLRLAPGDGRLLVFFLKSEPFTMYRRVLNVPTN